MKTPTPSRWKKWLKRLAFAVAALATLLALVYAAESYRGRRHWHQYRAELEAKGEVFDFRRLLPPPVPDDQNLFMTPLLRPFSDYVIDEKARTARLRDPEACERVTKLFDWTSRLVSTNRGWQAGQFRDLALFQQQLRDTNRPAGGPVWMLSAPTNKAEWSKAREESLNPKIPALQALAARPPGKPAEDLLFLLALNQAELDEIRAAAQRPGANLKARYDDGMRLLLPQLAMVKGLAQALSYSASAHLAHGDAATAALDVSAILKLAESLTAEPLLIVGLVHVAVRDLALQPLWEGLARHQWTDAQLADFDAAFQRARLVECMQRCLRGEQAFSISLLSGIKLAEDVAGHPIEDPTARVYASLPAPVRYQNQINIARLFQENILPALDVTAGTVDLARLDEKALSARAAPRRLYSALAVGAASAASAAGRNAGKAQAFVNLARVAIAIERYRLDQNALPAQLADLAPRWLNPVPPDPVNGQPLRYRRDAAEQFCVYSVGLDGRDDGGTVARSQRQSSSRDAAAGDWVWQNHPVTNTAATTASTATN